MARRGSTRAWRRLRTAVLERDGEQCTALVAGRRCSVRVGLEVHHLRPLAQGGSDHPTNLTTRCRDHHPRGGLWRSR